MKERTELTAGLNQWPMGIEDLFNFAFITEAQLAPDGKSAVYGVHTAGLEKNEVSTALWIPDLVHGISRALPTRTVRTVIYRLEDRWLQSGDAAPSDLLTSWQCIRTADDPPGSKRSPGGMDEPFCDRAIGSLTTGSKSGTCIRGRKISTQGVAL